MTESCILLYSSLATDQIQVVNSRRLEDSLSGRKIQFEKIDGSMTDSKEIRDALFSVSGQRGKYPQCFLKAEDGAYAFVGLWEEIENVTLFPLMSLLLTLRLELSNRYVHIHLLDISLDCL